MNSGKICIWRCSAEIINLSGERCVIAVASDITEQKSSEASLRESEERSRVILESIPQGVIFSDIDGKIIEINNAVRRMHKYDSKEELVERQFLELIPGKEHARISDNYKETLEAGYSGALLYHMIKKDGSLFSAELTAAVIKDDTGKPVGFVTVTEDISGRKNIEEQIRELEVLREVDNLRSQLLSNVSHELRTPLTSIKGFVSTLLRTDAEWSSEEQRDFLEIVNQEADRLTRLISDLLDMSRLDAGALKLNRDIHHVSTILESIESRLGNLTSGRRLIKNVPEDLPPVFVDEMRVGQVLTNLIENAIKYSPEGCDIVIEARPNGDDVVISVIDKGAGIPYELIDKIFDRFYQTESVVTGRKSGTGLGLSICRGIIQAHGGRIWVESKLGEGSNFSFSLPLDKEESHG
jgi:PAS domain S-box-containing protein